MLHIISFLTFLNSNFSIDQGTWKNLPLDSIYHIADRLTDEYKYQEAIERLDYLLSNEEKLNPELRWKTLSLLGYSHYFLGDYEESNRNHTKALEIKTQPKKVISTLRSMGMNYKEIGLSGLSLNNYLQALELNEKYDFDQKTQTELFNSISLLYLNMKDYEKSMEYSKKTIKQASIIGDTLLLAFGFNNLALNFHNIFQYDSSIYYHQLAVDLKKKTNYHSSLGTEFNNIGQNYMQINQFSFAKEYFDSANYYYHKSNSSVGKIVIKNNYGSYYLQTNNLPRAKSYLDSAFNLLKETPIKIHLIENIESQIDYFDRVKDYQSAYVMQKELSIVQNQLFQEEVLNTKNIENTYILNQKENEKLVLELDAKLARQLFTLVLIVAILLLILVTIYFSLSKKLKSKNAIIELQKTDILHRTSNVLAKVMSILKIISYGFEKENRQKLQLAESVILSAERLQRYTYGRMDDETEIKLYHYLQSLAHNVLETFHSNHASIRLVFDMKKSIMVDESKALNIGIIVSELILNAVKYAFKDSHQEPTIFVEAKLLEKKLVIQIRDNGQGLAEKTKSGTGTQMVQKLAHQIRGRLDLITSPAGTNYILTLNNL